MRHNLLFLSAERTLALLILMCGIATTVAWVPSSAHHYHEFSPSQYKRRVLVVHPAQQSTELEHQPEQQAIPILYDSDRLLIVSKPPGISHHNDKQILESEEDAGNEEPSSRRLGIVNLVREQYGEQQRLWGVHRLDRVTSGILVFAKDAEMAKELGACFANGDISKVYLGISAKRPNKKKQGWVQGGMVRSRDKSWKLVVKKKTTSTTANENVNTNFAKTRFFTAPFLHDEQKYTCLLFRPFTGKTHQLRVAAKAMGMPLLGDPIYKDGGLGNELNAPRTYLHASGIHIPPLDGHDEVSLWNEPPFQDLLGDTGAVDKLLEKHCDVASIMDARKELLL